jgi:PleD family two-component response regulator
MTNRDTVSSTSGTSGLQDLNRPQPGQTVMVVNGRESAMPLLEAVLDAGRYDVVFVESTERAYSHIKRVQPNLVILCTRLEDMGGFQVLSMLKLDKETCEIPVLTYTSDCESDDSSAEEREDDDIETDVFTAAIDQRLMN